MNRLKRGLLFFLVCIFILQKSTLFAWAAEKQYRMNLKVVVDDKELGEIPALDDNYENNMYLSLKGLACALRDTPKAFTPVVEKQSITITTGRAADMETDTEEMGESDSLHALLWDEEALNTVGASASARNKLYVDDTERKYYSVILPVGESYDAFLTPVSLAMIFDLDMKVTETGIEINTAVPFVISAEELEESGYMQSVNALLIGDGTTGEIFYQYAGDEVFPIASTTKLMTYFVFMDAVSQGQCSLEDKAVISQRAAVLSEGPDGVIPMQEGSQVPIAELLYGMLLPSSNECAMALAEHAAGSQEAFVEQMNEKALELGLANAEFYNSHGLPNYEDQLIPAKTHNHMTAEEMFQLVSALLDTYPQITEYTSAKVYHLETLGKDVKNTNVILDNMENAVGLKTGTTNKAGACLVTCVAAEKDGELHDLIVVLFGADGDANRGIVSEIAARYAVGALAKGESYDGKEQDKREKDGIPENPEAVVRKLLRCLAG